MSFMLLVLCVASGDDVSEGSALLQSSVMSGGSISSFHPTDAMEEHYHTTEEVGLSEVSSTNTMEEHDHVMEEKDLSEDFAAGPSYDGEEDADEHAEPFELVDLNDTSDVYDPDEPDYEAMDWPDLVQLYDERYGKDNAEISGLYDDVSLVHAEASDPTVQPELSVTVAIAVTSNASNVEKLLVAELKALNKSETLFNLSASEFTCDGDNDLVHTFPVNCNVTLVPRGVEELDRLQESGGQSHLVQEDASVGVLGRKNTKQKKWAAKMMSKLSKSVCTRATKKKNRGVQTVQRSRFQNPLVTPSYYALWWLG